MRHLHQPFSPMSILVMNLSRNWQHNDFSNHDSTGIIMFILLMEASTDDNRCKKQIALGDVCGNTSFFQVKNSRSVHLDSHFLVAPHPVGHRYALRLPPSFFRSQKRSPNSFLGLFLWNYSNTTKPMDLACQHGITLKS